MTRRSAAFPLGIAAILAVAVAAYWLLLARRVTAPSDVPPPPVLAVDAGHVAGLRIAQVNGSVEIRRAAGEWARAQVGAALQPSDGVRTGDQSFAVLEAEDLFEVRMEASTEVGVEELSETVSRILLGTGLASARVRGHDRHHFEVRAARSDAVLRTDAGEFSISNNGDGTVAVGTREGAVELRGRGKVVVVRAGQQSIVRPAEAPTDPTPIPGSLLLKVALPPSTVVRTPALDVSGRTEAGSLVEVAGHRVPVDSEGRFTVKVPLAEGPNALGVQATGVGGGRVESTHQVGLDTKVHKLSIDRDLWK